MRAGPGRPGPPWALGIWAHPSDLSLGRVPLPERAGPDRVTGRPGLERGGRPGEEEARAGWDSERPRGVTGELPATATAKRVSREAARQVL